MWRDAGELWLKTHVAGVARTICQAALDLLSSRRPSPTPTRPVKPTAVASLPERLHGVNYIDNQGVRQLRHQGTASEVVYCKGDKRPPANAARRLDTVLSRLVAAAHGRCLRRNDRASPMRVLPHRTRSPGQMMAISPVQSRRNSPARVGPVKRAIGARYLLLYAHSRG